MKTEKVVEYIVYWLDEDRDIIEQDVYKTLDDGYKAYERAIAEKTADESYILVELNEVTETWGGYQFEDLINREYKVLRSGY